MNQLGNSESAIKMLEEEKKIYEFLLGRMALQEQAIDSDNEKALMEVLDEKEHALENLREKNQSLLQWSSELSGAERGEMEEKTRALRTEIENTLHQIIELEELCEKKLQSKSSRMGQKLTGLKKGKVLLKGYNTPTRIKPKISKNV
ncbi:MAG: hypothetical protein COV66_01085 [Nitrospinae bacterium CG11_big_fil_rev_8_21_14_0_20_45_15]|nr:MAG: hypothetical protein COV66_01085 [Nitrospinae bacterium CG11_big_fil_rev_8_21_14_0_20_45_15]